MLLGVFKALRNWPHKIRWSWSWQIEKRKHAYKEITIRQHLYQHLLLQRISEAAWSLGRNTQHCQTPSGMPSLACLSRTTMNDRQLFIILNRYLNKKNRHPINFQKWHHKCDRTEEKSEEEQNLYTSSQSNDTALRSTKKMKFFANSYWPLQINDIW